MYKILVPMLALFACSACVSNVASPVTGEYRTALDLTQVTVDIPDNERIPDRYDRSVLEYISTDEALTADTIENFMAFADTRGGLTDETAGELMLEFLIQDSLERLVTGQFTGDRDAELDVTIVSTTFPNAATMMLVGEVIGASYEFELTVTDNGQIAVQSNRTLAPFVDRSAGAGGGLLGLALRGGENRHLRDLQNIADAVASQLAAVLSGRQVLESTAERVTTQPLN